MPSAIQHSQQTTSNTTTDTIRKQDNKFIFILRLYDGRLAIGQAANVARRIASINSGIHPSLPKSLMVKEIVGIKPITEERTYVSTVHRFCERLGSDAVVAV
jgi:predicted GIY-YIG superfamily endonuclease